MDDAVVSLGLSLLKAHLHWAVDDKLKQDLLDGAQMVQAGHRGACLSRVQVAEKGMVDLALTLGSCMSPQEADPILWRIQPVLLQFLLTFRREQAVKNESNRQGAEPVPRKGVRLWWMDHDR